jgi:hypothetical protein
MSCSSSTLFILITFLLHFDGQTGRYLMSPDSLARNIHILHSVIHQPLQSDLGLYLLVLFQ